MCLQVCICAAYFRVIHACVNMHIECTYVVVLLIHLYTGELLYLEILVEKKLNLSIQNFNHLESYLYSLYILN